MPRTWQHNAIHLGTWRNSGEEKVNLSFRSGGFGADRRGRGGGRSSAPEKKRARRGGGAREAPDVGEGGGGAGGGAPGALGLGRPR